MNLCGQIIIRGVQHFIGLCPETLTEKLEMRRVATKFVRQLRTEQVCENFLERANNDDS